MLEPATIAAAAFLLSVAALVVACIALVHSRKVTLAGPIEFESSVDRSDGKEDWRKQVL